SCRGFFQCRSRSPGIRFGSPLLLARFHRAGELAAPSRQFSTRASCVPATLTKIRIRHLESGFDGENKKKYSRRSNPHSRRGLHDAFDRRRDELSELEERPVVLLFGK